LPQCSTNWKNRTQPPDVKVLCSIFPKDGLNDQIGHHPAGVFSKKKSTPINDIEGWHNALERRAAGKRNLQFYPMIILLHKEARLTSPDDEQSPI
jgi:hypothetical protein